MLALRFALASSLATVLLIHTAPNCALADPAPSTGLHDDAFSQVPFNQWRAAGPHNGIPWELETTPAQLSHHQRLEAAIKVAFKVRDLARRASKSGSGKDLLAFVEVEDNHGVRWQTHVTVKAAQTASWEQHAFLLPGDYTWSVAVWDPAAREYSFSRRKLHVTPLKTDPLPASWTDLPKVEFVATPSESPDSWFLPEVTSHLRLPLQTHRRVHIDVLMNTTPAGRAAGSLGALRRNMSTLLPALKIVSSIQLQNGSMDVDLLDLTRRRVSFEQRVSSEQNDIHPLDWNQMSGVFTSANPALIDVATLAAEGESRTFFRDELLRAMRSGQPGNPNIVIVLSGPAFFDSSNGFSLSDLPDDPDRRLFYIRYRDGAAEAAARRRPRSSQPLGPPQRPMLFFALPLDDLQKPLAKTDARLYDATSAEEFRRVLSAVITQISRF